ncbi:MAG: hypothetical protein GY913_21335 [Proteobacteria bacterium]|nr:hypothetical protein [Pseudomonadota bacterium]MCP4919452.1 hypothetical protein [Pseudomonadota bacterium]
MSWLLLLACSKDEVVTPIDSDPVVVRESSVFGETGETADDSGGDTGEVQDLRLDVYPPEATLGVGGTLELRGVATDEDGARRDVELSLAPSGGEVSVSGGVVTGESPGEVVLDVTADGLTATASITVQDGHELVVHLVEAHTGAPMVDGRVNIDGVKSLADSSGTVRIDVTDGSPVTFTAYDASTDWIPAVVFGASVREITLPLRPVTDEDPATGEVSGTLDLSMSVPSEWDELIVGFSGSALVDEPLFYDGDELVGEERTVDFFGADVELPGNISLEEVDTSWTAGCATGDTGVWSFTVPVAINTMSAGLETVTDATALLAERADDVRYQWSGGHSCGDSVDLTPADELTESVVVELPAELPVGFYGTEDVLVLALEQVDEGRAIVGVGGGSGTLTIPRAEVAGHGTQVLAYAEVGGAGTGSGRVLQLVDDGQPLADWKRPPSIDAFDGATAAVELTTDTGHHVVRVHVLSFDGGRRDLYFAGGPLAETLPKVGPSMGYGRTIWRVRAVETAGETLQSALVNGALDPSSIEDGAVSTGLLEEQRTGG